MTAGRLLGYIYVRADNDADCKQQLVRLERPVFPDVTMGLRRALDRVCLGVATGSTGRQSMKRDNPTRRGRRIGYVDVVGQSLPLAYQRQVPSNRTC